MNAVLNEELEDEDSLPLRELRRLVGGSCIDCRSRFTAQEAVASIALGFKSAPRCWLCLARRLERPLGELQQELIAYVHRRECYLKAWTEAVALDGSPMTIEPTPEATITPESPAIPAKSEPSHFWNAGDLGCGELVMELRQRLASLSPGAEIELIATDPAAPEDIPSWCRLTGHSLVTLNHPHYVIRRKENAPCPANSPSV